MGPSWSEQLWILQHGAHDGTDQEIDGVDPRHEAQEQPGEQTPGATVQEAIDEVPQQHATPDQDGEIHAAGRGQRDGPPGTQRCLTVWCARLLPVHSTTTIASPTLAVKGIDTTL